MIDGRALICRHAVLRLLARCRVQGCADPIAVLIDAVERLPVHVQETARSGAVPAAPIESVQSRASRVVPITHRGQA